MPNEKRNQFSRLHVKHSHEFLKCFLQSKPPEDYGDEKGPADLPSSVAQAPHLAIGVGMAPPQGN